MVFLAMGGALGRPGRPLGELWALQGLLHRVSGNSIELSEGVLGISRALPPRFGGGPGRGPGRKSDIFGDFGRVKFLHEYPLGPRDLLGGSRERFEEVSGVKIA